MSLVWLSFFVLFFSGVKYCFVDLGAEFIRGLQCWLRRSPMTCHHGECYEGNPGWVWPSNETISVAYGWHKCIWSQVCDTGLGWDPSLHISRYFGRSSGQNRWYDGQARFSSGGEINTKVFDKRYLPLQKKLSFFLLSVQKAGVFVNWDGSCSWEVGKRLKLELADTEKAKSPKWSFLWGWRSGVFFGQ